MHHLTLIALYCGVCVWQVFQRLDSHKSGRVSVTSVRRFCRHASNDIEGVWFGHTHQSTLQADLATINYTVR